MRTVKANSKNTEGVPSLFIDQLKPYHALDFMMADMEVVTQALRQAQGAVLTAAYAGTEWLKKSESSRIVYIGAGTSGRLGVLDRSELGVTFSWPEGRSLFIIAGGDRAITESVEGGEDNVNFAEIAVAHRVQPNDLVIAVSASGTTPFTLAAMRTAKKRGALTIGIANNRETPILEEATHSILLETGPECVIGSTRLKAATAQNVALKYISTLIMVNLGKVHNAVMTDVEVTNKKLQSRAVRNVVRLARCKPCIAQAMLEKTGWHVGISTLCLRTGMEPDAAAALYHGPAQGNLKEALKLTAQQN